MIIFLPSQSRLLLNNGAIDQGFLDIFHELSCPTRYRRSLGPEHHRNFHFIVLLKKFLYMFDFNLQVVRLRLGS